MKHLLFLAHRLPYPPNKGDKVRSYHMLRHLADRYHVHLGTFINDPDDRTHVDHLKRLCVDVFCLSLDRRWVRSVRGLLYGEALTVSCYRDPRMQAWVDGTVSDHRVERIFVFSGAMAQYASRHLREGVCGVVDFVDIDSDKWRQYAEHCTWPLASVYARESVKLLAYERETASRFHRSVFVSRAEATQFSRLAPESAERVTYLSNGVDATYFCPARAGLNPYAPDERVLVFTGAMDYRANVDAVRWFAHEVFPRVRAQRADARLHIVGAHPTASVRRLGEEPGVKVRGRVDDIRPYIAHAVACIAPLRIARGVQNKVLEALAMGKPVLATPAAVAGLDGHPKNGVVITDDPSVLASHAARLIEDGQAARSHAPELAAHLRGWVREHHDWARNLRAMNRLLEPAHANDIVLKPPVGAVVRR